MPDALTEIQQEQSRFISSELEQARKDESWASRFASTPTIEVMRAKRNLGDMLLRAVENKQRLQAQTDLKAQELYYTGKKWEEWEANRGNRDDLLEAQIAHERALTAASGLTARNKLAAETRELEEITALGADIREIPYAQGTDEYLSELNKRALNHPAALNTPAGRQIFKQFSQPKAPTIPDGYEPEITVTDDGWSVRHKPKKPDAIEQAVKKQDELLKGKARFEATQPKDQKRDPYLAKKAEIEGNLKMWKEGLEKKPDDATRLQYELSIAGAEKQLEVLNQRAPTPPSVATDEKRRRLEELRALKASSAAR